MAAPWAYRVKLRQNRVVSHPGMKSAFTVTNPTHGSTSTTIRFSNAITNVGGHYRVSTGIFTCEFPGIYVFELHILQMSSKHANCEIRQNNSRLVIAHSNPNGDNGYYSTSNSVVIHLKEADTVDVYCSTGISSIHSHYSTFSGFLLKAD